jgi:hypothetical protein
MKQLQDLLSDGTNSSCVKFEERGEGNYVQISKGDGCYVDYIGKRVSGAQNLYLHENCLDDATIKHQLIHVLGFDHEQNRFDCSRFKFSLINKLIHFLRPDRDEHITVYLDNIQDGISHYSLN